MHCPRYSLRNVKIATGVVGLDQQICETPATGNGLAWVCGSRSVEGYYVIALMPAFQLSSARKIVLSQQEKQFLLQHEVLDENTIEPTAAM